MNESPEGFEGVSRGAGDPFPERILHRSGANAPIAANQRRQHDPLHLAAAVGSSRTK